MGCRFCASTIGGLVRKLLTVGDARSDLPDPEDTGERVSNVVVMGTGEPLDNYDNLLKFIRMLRDENGLNISQRNHRIHLRDCAADMADLAEENLQITLALSLHAPNEEKRKN